MFSRIPSPAWLWVCVSQKDHCVRDLRGRGKHYQGGHCRGPGAVAHACCHWSLDSPCWHGTAAAPAATPAPPRASFGFFTPGLGTYLTPWEGFGGLRTDAVSSVFSQPSQAPDSTASFTFRSFFLPEYLLFCPQANTTDISNQHHRHK